MLIWLMARVRFHTGLEYKCLILFCTLLAFFPAQASEHSVIVLEKGIYQYTLAQKVEVLKDLRSRSAPLLQLKDVLRSGPQHYFYTNMAPRLSLGEERSDHWLRIKIRNAPNNNSRRWVLQIPYLLSKAEIYPFYSDIAVPTTAMVANSLPAMQPYSAAQPFAFSLQAGQQLTLYLRLMDKIDYLSLQEEAHYYQQAGLRDMLLSAYFSIFLAMMLYNLLLFFIIRDISYLYYVLYCLGFVFTQLFLTGFGLQHLWPDHPWLEAYLGASIGVTGAFGALTVRSFLNIPSFLPRLDLALKLLVLFFAYIALSVFWDYGFLNFQLISLAAIVNVILLFVAAVIIWQKGFRPARYYIVGISLLIFSILIYYLSVFELIPSSFFTRQCVKFSAIIETILLSLGLADRINMAKKEKTEAQNRVIAVLQESRQIQEKANQELQSAYQELLESKGESSKLQELDQLKTRFFANISHEFRTPLTLILGPLEQFMHNPDISESSRQEVEMMYRSARRLLHLINQLLDLSKLEANQLKLVLARGNFLEVVRSLTSTFSSLAEARRIRLSFQGPQQPLMACFDHDKLEQIVTNLLSNAIKFTSDGGQVKVAVSVLPPDAALPGTLAAGRYIQLKISDTGMGIPASQLDKIFDRFYQVDGTHTRTYEGTGIGLALVKELVQLHKGFIQVHSLENEGTTFTVLFPVANCETEQVAVRQNGAEATTNRQALLTLLAHEHDADTNTMPEPLEAATQPIMLIVDDSADIRLFIRRTFGAEFRVLEAKDGEEGFQLAIQKIPDIVISDYMMPRMGGQELCEKLKTDERTSHIPVILLTARASIETRLHALETGADDYVVKPFHLKLLRVRVRNLIKSRSKLRNQFSRELVLKPKEVAINSTDERFLQKLTDILEKNLADPDFSVEAFCKEAGLSRVNMHRKLKGLTDQSASEFIRLFRLQRAAQLLARHAGGSAEIAYQVGFNNLSYFAKCFKEVYGKTPSEYAAEHTLFSREEQ